MGNSALDHIHNVVKDDAYKRGYENGRKDAIPVDWIERYADWLTTIPAPFAANDERSIRAMLAKWKTNPDLPKPECSEDACDL